MTLFGRNHPRCSTSLLGLLLGLMACTVTKNQPAAGSPASPAPTSILLLGCNHLSGLYKAGNLNSDMLAPKRQAELATVLDQLQRYRPDGILVEELPERQAQLDSLYHLYRQDKLTCARCPAAAPRCISWVLRWASAWGWRAFSA